MGAASVEPAGLKADLAALRLGVMVAYHPKAAVLAKHLIGLSGIPTLANLGAAGLLAMAVPFRVILFFLLLTRFRLRARTAVLASLSLASYSEFGLIVGTLAAANGWIGGTWLVTLAVALALTFVLAAPRQLRARGFGGVIAAALHEAQFPNCRRPAWMQRSISIVKPVRARPTAPRKCWRRGGR